LGRDRGSRVEPEEEGKKRNLGRKKKTPKIRCSVKAWETDGIKRKKIKKNGWGESETATRCEKDRERAMHES